MNTACLSAFSARAFRGIVPRRTYHLSDAPTDNLQGRVDIQDVASYHGSLQGLGDLAPQPIGSMVDSSSSLPTDIQSIATSVSQAIQATTNPNMVPFVGNLTPGGTLPVTAATAGISAGTLLLLGVGAFFLFRRR